VNRLLDLLSGWSEADSFDAPLRDGVGACAADQDASTTVKNNVADFAIARGIGSLTASVRSPGLSDQNASGILPRS
jgi:hypothetical protein